MSRVEELERDIRIARQIAGDAQERQDPRWFNYTCRSYAAWKRFELENRPISQIDR
jgi:hypothetical protein